jgi:transcriptional regulator with XRE-family HTH domain
MQGITIPMHGNARLFPYLKERDRVPSMNDGHWDRPQDRAEVGRRLRLLEQAVGVNGAQMARLLGVPAQTWSNWKNGVARIPSYFAAQLKREFGCSLDWLYIGDSDANTGPFRDKLAKAKEKGPPPQGKGRRVKRLDELDN